jgi:hypothetical protein
VRAKVPDWRSSWSTSVVLPWSTWAMMAMLRLVDAVRGGEKIGSISIEGDYAPLFEQMKARLARWNETLDQSARP